VGGREEEEGEREGGEGGRGEEEAGEEGEGGREEGREEREDAEEATDEGETGSKEEEMTRDEGERGRDEGEGGDGEAAREDEAEREEGEEGDAAVETETKSEDCTAGITLVTVNVSADENWVHDDGIKEAGWVSTLLNVMASFELAWLSVMVKERERAEDLERVRLVWHVRPVASKMVESIIVGKSMMKEEGEKETAIEPDTTQSWRVSRSS